jgi:hypothetical protein
MVSTGLLNLIVAIAAIAILAAVMRFAYVIAGSEAQETHAENELGTSYDLEQAA